MSEYVMPINSTEAAERFARLGCFTQAYIECALWLLDEDLHQHFGGVDAAAFDDLAPETVEAMAQECLAFVEANAADIGDAEAQAGHDLWLTRNGHGTGFWDRTADTYGTADARDRLDAAAKAAGPRGLYLGDDGKLYQGEG